MFGAGVRGNLGTTGSDGFARWLGVELASDGLSYFRLAKRAQSVDEPVAESRSAEEPDPARGKHTFSAICCEPFHFTQVSSLLKRAVVVMSKAPVQSSAVSLVARWKRSGTTYHDPLSASE